MFILALILHVFACLAIVGLVLLQAGKGADIGSAFGGTGSQAVFGSMGTPTVLGKATTAVALVFMVTSFFLASQMRRSPAALAVAALCAAGLAAAGCSHEVEGRPEDRSAGAGPPAYGDTFVHAFISDIAGLIPNITSDAASHEVGDRIYDGLVSNDKDLNWTGQLAESWDFSPDCLTLTFHLRRNVRWHDGHPFTADDVKFTYEAMINPKTPTGYRDDFLQVKSLEVVDPYTVRITYPRPHARALRR